MCLRSSSFFFFFFFFFVFVTCQGSEIFPFAIFFAALCPGLCFSSWSSFQVFFSKNNFKCLSLTSHFALEIISCWGFLSVVFLPFGFVPTFVSSSAIRHAPFLQTFIFVFERTRLDRSSKLLCCCVAYAVNFVLGATRGRWKNICTNSFLWL